VTTTTSQWPSLTPAKDGFGPEVELRELLEHQGPVLQVLGVLFPHKEANNGTSTMKVVAIHLPNSTCSNYQDFHWLRGREGGRSRSDLTWEGEEVQEVKVEVKTQGKQKENRHWITRKMILRAQGAPQLDSGCCCLRGLAPC